MNWPLLIAGVLSALATIAHAFVAERMDIRHLMASDVAMAEKVILRSVWHTYSIALGGSALLLFYAIFVENAPVVNTWLLGLGIFHTLCGLMFLLLLLVTQRDHLVRVPQWLLLLVIGGLMWWGTASL